MSVRDILLWPFRAVRSLIVWLWSFTTETLCNEKMPVWVSLCLFALTAWGTYKLSPEINGQFEKQKIQSAYIVSSLESFNGLSRTLISKIGLFNNRFIDTNQVDTKLKEEIQSQITELQWRALELDMIFDDPISLTVLQSYKESLEGIRVKLLVIKELHDIAELNKTVQTFADCSFKVFAMLAKRSGLKVDLPIEDRNTPK